MASNTPATPAASPLTFMTKLSPCVYFYRPATPSPAPNATTTTTTSPPPPKLILVASWMGARDPHIAKYLVRYQALYPTSPILLVRGEPRHWFLPGSAARDLAPATPVLRSIFPELTSPPAPPEDETTRPPTPTPTPPTLLIHAFSNGGVASLHTLRQSLSLSPAAAQGGSGNGSGTLPPYTLILDSAPGTLRYRPGYRAFTAGLSGLTLWLAAPFVHALCAWFWFWNGVVRRGKAGRSAVLRRALNDGASRGREARRTYVYSEGDLLVDWRDVEAHARAAEGEGFVVRREKFVGSEHVAHARLDAGRYWEVVKGTWEGKGGLDGVSLS